MSGDREAMTMRRIYVLPSDLVEHIQLYQKTNGISSEVEAVRRLLTEAIRQRDRPADIIGRAEAAMRRGDSYRKAAGEVISHPLVSHVLFFEAGFRFIMKGGQTGAVGRVPDERTPAG